MSVFKTGDKVYFPKASRLVLTVQKDEHGTEAYPINIQGYNLTHDGKDSINDRLPSIFRATEENRKLLEQLYGAKFEAPPTKPSSKEIIQAMLRRGDKYVLCWVSDCKRNPDQYCKCGLVTDYKGELVSPYITERNPWRYATPFNPTTGEPITELPE